jgi:cation transport regulator
MPYSKMSELPEAIQGLPKHAAEVWMAAYNAAVKEYKGDEAKCAATAWAAVKVAGYAKNEAGEWTRSKESAVAESLVRLSAFGQGSTPEVKHVAADWCAVGVNDKTYRVGYTTSGNSYAFGKAVLMTVAEADALEPEPPRESFTAKESEQIQFTVAEGVNIDGEIYHAKPDAGEYPVFIVAEGINRGKKRQYTGKCMESVTGGFYDGVPMFLDHVGEEGKVTVRSVRDLAGKVLKSGRAIVHEGVKKIPGVVRFMGWAKEQAKDPDWRGGVGLSHVADVAGYVGKVGKETLRVIESIVHPYSVDVVSSAAFGGRVMESNGVDSRVEDLTMLETLKIDDLNTHRPDLVTAIKESARAEFRVQESDDEAVKAATARADAAEARAKASDAALRKVQVKEAAAVEVAKPDLKVPEAARTLIVNRVADRLGGAEISADKLSATVSEAVNAEIALGQAFAPAKAIPDVPPNHGGGDAETKRAKLQETFDAGYVRPKPKAD